MSIENQLTGRIFNIQRMSLHDGPGIRTTVFFKGCNLRCFWCHNPESWNQEKEIQYFPARCIGCGECVIACPLGEHILDPQTHLHEFLRHNCINCGKCALVCPSGSLALTGEDWDVPSLIHEVLRDKPFFQHSSGGITVSGGEPLMQVEFVAAFLKQLKAIGINTAMESAFHVPFSAIESVRPYVDFFLIDLKHPDPDKHKEYTGRDNLLILENIRLLDKTDARYCIRIPIVPGVNDDPDTMEKLDLVVGALKNPEYIEFMPYHLYGINKFVSLGQDFAMQDSMEPPVMASLLQFAKSIKSFPVRFRSGAEMIHANKGG